MLTRSISTDKQYLILPALHDLISADRLISSVGWQSGDETFSGVLRSVSGANGRAPESSAGGTLAPKLPSLGSAPEHSGATSFSTDAAQLVIEQ